MITDLRPAALHHSEKLLAHLEPDGKGETGHRFSTTEGDDHMVEHKKDGGEIFLEVLNRHGVEYIIGSPGSEWRPCGKLCRAGAPKEFRPPPISTAATRGWR